ncbi:hypothetical protein [Marinomonas rhodophyticola]|uniref:Gamma-glutamyltranspeptidase n=1 Tax=Marinomonas rhodophyticola TaxID=2992803 RepID=A0ABT3KEY8_9GAMM|nr:hypothetical protein [Marinomonas sp. KJ51-3]MCW4629090.1 hypothetical protein [Marinomonas sp. KJ51-3]
MTPKKRWLHILCSIPLFIASQDLLAEAQAVDPMAPESASGIEEKTLTKAKEFMVATANPEASKAGYDVLKAGGSAIDALVAVQMVLGLVSTIFRLGRRRVCRLL